MDRQVIDETVRELQNNIREIRMDLKELKDSVNDIKVTSKLLNAFHKLWRAEDIEENDGKFRWPFNEYGNVMENVTMTGDTDGTE